MPYGFGAALTWALDTVILGIALANPAFAATPQAIALAAFTSTFLHDASSAVFSFAYMGIRASWVRPGARFAARAAWSSWGQPSLEVPLA